MRTRRVVIPLYPPTYGCGRHKFPGALVDFQQLTEPAPLIPRYPLSSWSTGYSWNRKPFLDPTEFLRILYEPKLHVSLNDHPADGVREYDDSYQKIATAMESIPRVSN